MSSYGSDAESLTRALADLEAALPRKGRVLILTHDYPDPDALAAAGAVHLLLEKRFGRHSRIVFTGMVARAENRELLRHFRYKWSMYDPLRPGRRTQPAILVDAQPGSGNITLPRGARTIAVFDHHPLQREVAPGVFADVRPLLGASVTMLWQYLAACDIVPPPWLATCMVYAILTETIDFSRGLTPDDREAYLALLARANLRMLGRIQHAPLSRLYFGQLKDAIANARVYDRIAWTHMPDVPQPEIIPEMADRLGRIERITWSFCTGFHDGNLLLSLRSNRRHARCGNILRRVFRGVGSAGGHDRMAAGSSDVSALPAGERGVRLEELTRRLLKILDRRHAQRADADVILAQPLAQPSPPPDHGHEGVD